MSDRDELARAVRTGFFGLHDGDVDVEDLQMADAVLASDWLARVKREAAADAWDQGHGSCFHVHPPTGCKNPHREDSE